MRRGLRSTAVLVFTVLLAVGCASKSRRVSDVRIDTFEATATGVLIELELLDFGDRATVSDGVLSFELFQGRQRLGCALEHTIVTDDGSTIRIEGAFQGTCDVDPRHGPAHLEVSFRADDPKHRLARNLKGAPDFLGGDGLSPDERRQAAVVDSGLDEAAYARAVTRFQTEQAMLRRAGHRIVDLAIEQDPDPCDPAPARQAVPVQTYGRLVAANDLVSLATYMDSKLIEPVPPAAGPWGFLRDPVLTQLAAPSQGKAVVDAVAAVRDDGPLLRIVEVAGAPEGRIEGRLIVINRAQGEFVCVTDFAAAGGEGYEDRVRAAVDAVTPEGASEPE